MPAIDSAATGARHMDGSIISKTEAERTEAFLSGLTELSMKHGIAITGKPVLFVMQNEDYAFPIVSIKTRTCPWAKAA
jgi:hypothetical protein